MAVCGIRSRRLTEPFNEKIRERIFGISSTPSTTSSSGSEHDGENDAISVSSFSRSSSPSPCLSNLVQNFLEETSNPHYGVFENDTINHDADDDYHDKDSESCSPSSSSDRAKSIIQEAIGATSSSGRENDDQFRRNLHSQVSIAVESLSLCRQNKSNFNRSMMGYLRGVGYDAALCKTKWEPSASGSLTAGSHEYIDVIDNGAGGRYIVELNFRDQFQIARETERYGRVVAVLPGVFIGKADDMKRVLRVMADEMRWSMKSGGISLPPWRKLRYLQAMWFGPYRRTTNQIPWMSMGTSPSVGSAAPVAKCRAVGFFGAAGGMVTTSGLTRTR